MPPDPPTMPAARRRSAASRGAAVAGAAAPPALPAPASSRPSDEPSLDPTLVTPAAVAVIDADLRIGHIEGRAFSRHGLDVTGWRGRDLAAVLTPYMRRELLGRVREALSGQPVSFDYQSKDGSRTYAVQLSPIRDTDGAVASAVATAQDITARIELAREATRSRDRLQEAERMVGVGSWELHVLDGRITFSPGFARLLGISEDTPLTLEAHRSIVHPDDRRALSEAGRACLLTGSATCEHRIVRPDGEIRLLSLRAEMTTGAADETVMRGAVLDVTAQRAQERRRLLAEQQFREAFDSAPIGMALSDPSSGRYLRVNDALCRMLDRSRAELLATTFDAVSHPSDQPPVRLAISELLAGTRPESRHEKRYLRPDGSEVWGLLHLSALRAPDGSVSALHSQIVDVTERKAREERLEQEVADAAWLGRIRDALDHGGLELFAQPIVDLVTGETVQNELLLRMRDAGGAIISPGMFLPVAERYGLISEIDRWVIHEAVRIAATGTPAEFNLSARSVSEPATLLELERAIAEAGIDPRMLVVEITETALMSASDAGSEFARRVRELGCRLALDDFGTGFSSLSYLKHLPADHLKIDIEFVRDLTASETDARVVRGIVGLAREFNQVTIAEGVEDEATLLRLRELGVDLAQGYLLGVPSPCTGGGPGGTPSSRPPEPRSQPGDGGVDDVAIVRQAFDAFARRDLELMLAHCSADVVLRAFGTARRAGRDEPYRGADGIRRYLADASAQWDSLTVVPRIFRPMPGGVIVFGDIDAVRSDARERLSAMWIARMRGGRITSLEVFQGAG